MDYNNKIKRTVQKKLFKGIKAKRVIGLAGPTPEEYLNILKKHSKEQFLCDYNPNKDYVQKNSLIGLYQLENPDWIDADFCSSIIDNWNDILYLYKELQMSNFKTTYFTFNVSLRTGRSHKYTFDWVRSNIINFSIVETKKQKFEGKQYIIEYITDNPNIILIEYFHTSYMLSVRVKHNWEINISTECKRAILSRKCSKYKELLTQRVYSWYRKGYVDINGSDGNKGANYCNLVISTKLPTKRQFDLGIKTRSKSKSNSERTRVLNLLKEFISIYDCFPMEKINNKNIKYGKFGCLYRNLTHILVRYPESDEAKEIIKLKEEYNSHNLESKELYFKFLEAIDTGTFNWKHPLYEKIRTRARCNNSKIKYTLKIKELYNQYKSKQK